jgi:chromosome segregation ATPase
MTNLVGFLGRKSASSDKPTLPSDSSLELDEELFSALGSQMGGDNETVRNLLLHAGYKIGELDDIKNSITQLIEPVGRTLRAFEVEKAEKISLQGSLNTARADYSKLRDEFGALQKQSAAAVGEATQLRQELATATRTIAALEGVQAELTDSSAGLRARVTDLENRLSHEAAETRRMREDGGRLNERLIAADRRSVQLESELTAARQKLSLADSEKRTLQASLEKTIAEAARVARRLLETEHALTASQTRLRQIEAQFSELSNERLRLASALEEANERHDSEASAAKSRAEALASRVAASERLLIEAREQLMARADDLRKLERQVSELSLAHDTLDNKLNVSDLARSDADAKIHEIEQSRAVLHDRNAALARTVNSKDLALQRADEKIAALTENLAALAAQLDTNRQTYTREIADVNAALSREKVERAVAEGALEAGRKDLARVMREVMALQRRQSAEEPAPRLVSANAA